MLGVLAQVRLALPNLFARPVQEPFLQVQLLLALVQLEQAGAVDAHLPQQVGPAGLLGVKTINGLLAQADGVVLRKDLELRQEALRAALLPDEPVGDAVKRAADDACLLGCDLGANALGHVDCGLVRVREHEHLVGQHSLLLNEVADALRQGLGLPRPRAGQHEQALALPGHGILLGWV